MAHDSDHCQEIFAALSEYLDLELPPGDCEQIREHLAGCPPCIEFVASLQKSIELCHGYKPGAGPGPLKEEARAQLEAAWREMLRSQGRSAG